MKEANEKQKGSKIQMLPLYSADPTKKFSEKEETLLREMVTCEFMNLEEPGTGLTFSYGNAQNKHTFEFEHGKRYDVPRFIQRHVEDKSTPIWKYTSDGEGSMHKELKGQKSRFQMREIY